MNNIIIRCNYLATNLTNWILYLYTFCINSFVINYVFMYKNCKTEVLIPLKSYYIMYLLNEQPLS